MIHKIITEMINLSNIQFSSKNIINIENKNATKKIS